MGVRFLALVAIFCTLLVPRMACAEIEISLDAQPVRSVLFLRQPSLTSVVIVLQEPPAFSAPLPYPGGCFNCSTLPSNRSNAATSIFRSHAVEQNLYKENSGSQILYIH